MFEPGTFSTSGEHSNFSATGLFQQRVLYDLYSLVSYSLCHHHVLISHNSHTRLFISDG